MLLCRCSQYALLAELLQSPDALMNLPLPGPLQVQALLTLLKASSIAQQRLIRFAFMNSLDKRMHT